MTEEVAALADPLCRPELERADAGELGPEAARLLAHLRDAGPSLLDDVKTELALPPKAVRALRNRLERVGALVAQEVKVGDDYATELCRWDQVVPEPAAGGLDELVVAGVRAAVLAPREEIPRWFSWRADPDRLVAEERLVDLDGWLSLP
jgi:hypothetical protein